jgi:hypothetical protein
MLLSFGPVFAVDSRDREGRRRRQQCGDVDVAVEHCLVSAFPFLGNVIVGEGCVRCSGLSIARSMW